ncbi:Uncharacterised protein [Enterobacter cloacae]|nr:Uncharacterised protein [Enterobacter cloacae]
MQRKRREEKQSSGAHGVVTIIDNRHAKALFHIEDLQTLMPVMVAHRIGKQAAERGHGIVQGDQFQKVGCRRVVHSAIKLNFFPSDRLYKPPF